MFNLIACVYTGIFDLKSISLIRRLVSFMLAYFADIVRKIFNLLIEPGAKIFMIRK